MKYIRSFDIQNGEDSDSNNIQGNMSAPEITDVDIESHRKKYTELKTM